MARSAWLFCVALLFDLGSEIEFPKMALCGSTFFSLQFSSISILHKGRDGSAFSPRLRGGQSENPDIMLMQKALELQEMLQNDEIEENTSLSEQFGTEAAIYMKTHVSPLLAQAAKEIIKEKPFPSFPARWLSTWFERASKLESDVSKTDNASKPISNTSIENVSAGAIEEGPGGTYERLEGVDGCALVERSSRKEPIFISYDQLNSMISSTPGSTSQRPAAPEDDVKSFLSSKKSKAGGVESGFLRENKNGIFSEQDKVAAVDGGDASQDIVDLKEEHGEGETEDALSMLREIRQTQARLEACLAEEGDEEEEEEEEEDTVRKAGAVVSSMRDEVEAAAQGESPSSLARLDTGAARRAWERDCREHTSQEAHGDPDEVEEEWRQWRLQHMQDADAAPSAPAYGSASPAATVWASRRGAGSDGEAAAAQTVGGGGTGPGGGLVVFGTGQRAVVGVGRRAAGRERRSGSENDTAATGDGDGPVKSDGHGILTGQDATGGGGDGTSQSSLAGGGTSLQGAVAGDTRGRLGTLGSRVAENAGKKCGAALRRADKVKRRFRAGKDGAAAARGGPDDAGREAPPPPPRAAEAASRRSSKAGRARPGCTESRPDRRGCGATEAQAQGQLARQQRPPPLPQAGQVAGRLAGRLARVRPDRADRGAGGEGSAAKRRRRSAGGTDGAEEAASGGGAASAACTGTNEPEEGAGLKGPAVPGL